MVILLQKNTKHICIDHKINDITTVRLFKKLKYCTIYCVFCLFFILMRELNKHLFLLKYRMCAPLLPITVYLSPYFSLSDVLCDPTDPICRKETPFEPMTGRTAPSSDGLLAEVFLSRKANARRSVHSPRFRSAIVSRQTWATCCSGQGAIG